MIQIPHFAEYNTKTVALVFLAGATFVIIGDLMKLFVLW